MHEEFGCVGTPHSGLFLGGLELLRQHDRANDWDEQSCQAAACSFLEAHDQKARVSQRPWLEALYNAAVAFERCHRDAQAQSLFRAILAADPRYHRARVRLAIHAFEASGRQDMDLAIRELDHAIRDAGYHNAEALVQLAMVQMRRQASSEGDGCANDLCRAKKNLQRALAIDDGFLPAYNQLALYYLALAKQKAGREDSALLAAGAAPGKLETPALELAALVCSQALRRDPHYPPVHNTSGLVSAELGDYSAAVQSFERARTLDPRFFEAHLNYGAIHLRFRSFERAEVAYRAAKALRSGDYDVHLGLALALRAQVASVGAGNANNPDAKVDEAQAELGEAIRLAPERAEAHFNLAILIQEYRAPRSADPIAGYLEARLAFERFVSLARDRPDLRPTVELAQGRIADLMGLVSFLREPK
jgi:Tfp pilus assembly protein PilF